MLKNIIISLFLASSVQLSVNGYEHMTHKGACPKIKDRMDGKDFDPKKLYGLWKTVYDNSQVA